MTFDPLFIFIEIYLLYFIACIPNSFHLKLSVFLNLMKTFLVSIYLTAFVFVLMTF